MKTLKSLIIAECQRIIEILEAIPEDKKHYFDGKAELKAKMHELRRDTVALENKLYIR